MPNWISWQNVVNYFQNLYLCDCKQLKAIAFVSSISCELLSKFVPLWLQTTYSLCNFLNDMLWITFKICIFVTSNNKMLYFLYCTLVVNYFQNSYLCDSQQRQSPNSRRAKSCELLSKFVSLWLPTTGEYEHKLTIALWITFKICIFVTPNNKKNIIRIFAVCCELRSKFVSFDFQQLKK